MTAAQKTLLDEARHNPYRLFTADEIATLLDKSEKFVLAAKKAGAPFPGNVSRPEWVLEWLRRHSDFQVK